MNQSLGPKYASMFMSDFNEEIKFNDRHLKDRQLLLWLLRRLQSLLSLPSSYKHLFFIDQITLFLTEYYHISASVFQYEIIFSIAG